MFTKAKKKLTHSEALEIFFKDNGFDVVRESRHIIHVNGYRFYKLYPNKQSAIIACNHKQITKRMIEDMGIKTPKYKVFSPDDSHSLPCGLKYPIVVKPTDGGLSRDVFAGISNIDDYKKAVFHIIRKGKTPLIEEYIEGTKYRCLLTRKGFISVIKYELPFLVGDGISMVKKLLSRHETANVIDDWCLRSQNVNKRTRLDKGEVVYPTYIAALSHGSHSEELMPMVPSALSPLPKVVNSISGLYACGIDCIVDNNGVLNIIEINANSMIRNVSLIHKGDKVNAFQKLCSYYLELVSINSKKNI